MSLIPNPGVGLFIFVLVRSVRNRDWPPLHQWLANSILYISFIYYSWNGGRAEAVCAGGKGVRMR